MSSLVAIYSLKIGDLFTFESDSKVLYTHAGHGTEVCYYYHSIVLKEKCDRKTLVYKVEKADSF